MARRLSTARTGPLARSFALAGSGVFALVAVLSGLDRASAYREDGTVLVPQRFAGQSAQVLAAKAVASNDPVAIEAAGRLLIDRQPVNASAPATLGLAHALVGDVAGADAAFTVSGQLGWRAPLTQQYWMGRALAAGDYRVAAQRLDALLRQSPEVSENGALMAVFEQNPPARAALLAQLLQRPGWLHRYETQVFKLDPQQTQQRASLIADLAARGMRLECEDVRSLVERMVTQGAPEPAAALWRAQCPSPRGKGGLLWDGGLVAVNFSGPAVSFKWLPEQSGDVGLSAVADGVEITSTAAFTAPALRQFVAVPAGRYRLTWRADDGKGPRLLPTWGCTPDGGTSLAPQALGGGRWQADVVADGACRGHWLRFMVRTGEGPVRLGDVALLRNEGAASLKRAGRVA